MFILFTKFFYFICHCTVLLDIYTNVYKVDLCLYLYIRSIDPNNACAREMERDQEEEENERDQEVERSKKQERRTKVLLVDPESNCRLVNIYNGDVCWLIERNTPLVYAYHQHAVKDYLTIVGGQQGTMDLYRHRPYTEAKMIRCTKEKDIGTYLNKEYDGKLKIEASSECMYINGKTGAIAEKSPRNFLIVRKDYKISFYKFYSTRPYKTTVSWQLDFSRFRAFFPHSNQELDRVPVYVFHTINQDAFYEFCTNFKVKEESNISLLEHLKWKRPQDKVSPIILFEKFVANSNMLLGEYGGLEVAVEKLKRKGDLSKHEKNLRILGAHDNILGLLKAERNGIYDIFAFQNTFTVALKDYLNSKWGKPKRTNRVWIKVLRGIINGLRFLHTHQVRHGKLNPHNVFIKDNCVAKLAGLAHIDWPSDEEKGCMDEYLRADIYDWGKILVNIITNGHSGGEETWNHESVPDILEKLLPEDEEVKDLLSKVLQKDYKLRPTLEKILEHPIFCDWQTRCELMAELSDFCELKRKGGHEVIRHLDQVVGPRLFNGTSWKSKFAFDDDVLKEVEGYGEELSSLLRFFRNIMSHHSEKKAFFRGLLGANKAETELLFRVMFPNLFMSLHEVVKKHLANKFRHHLEVKDVDFRTQAPQSLKNPYI